MKLLTIDVGINNLGIALFSNSSLDKTKVITATSKQSVEKRLFNIFYNLDSLIATEFENEKEKYLVYEIPYFGFNSKTGKILDYVVGVIHLLAYKHDLILKSFTATEIKKAVDVRNDTYKKTREENKNLVKQSVQSILKLDLSHLTDHEIDAIAVALCFLHKNKEEKNASNKKRRN